MIIDLERIPVEELPRESFISTVSLAELAAGPHATDDPDERARRQERLQRVEGLFDPLPFDVGSSRAFGVVYAAVLTAGRKARGRRMIDLLIASEALAQRMPLYTANPDDFVGLEAILEVVAVSK